MSQVREKRFSLENYPHHLPDQPPPLDENGKISYEDFFEWIDEDTLAEWVDGEIEMGSPVNIKHERINSFLYRLLDSFVRIYDLGEIIQAPFQMKLPEKKGSGREPDLIFIGKAHSERLEEGLVRGAGDLVVEIVSPESRERDRETKFREYAQGGVAEYWLIDPDEKESLFYQLDNTGHYQAIAPDEQGRYHSRGLPGLWLQIAWLWQQPFPNDEELLLEICGPVYQQYLTQSQLKIGGEEAVQQITAQILDAGGEEYARVLIEQLQKRGLLPPA